MSDTKTPEQWASAKGKELSSFYAGARALHGWNEHEHHTGAPIQLTEEQFDGAVAAVADKRDGFTPHWPALSPFAAIKPPAAKPPAVVEAPVADEEKA
jgi:hypothetical protein